NERGELVSVLMTDEEVEAEERRTEDLRAEFRKASQPLIDDLLQAGIAVADLQDFKRRPIPRNAVAIRLRWLPEIKDTRVKEVIVRARTAPAAKPAAAKPLIREFLSAPIEQDNYKWVIGNALETVSDKSVLDDLLKIASARQHGSSRKMIISALGKFKDARVLEVLLKLLA